MMSNELRSCMAIQNAAILALGKMRLTVVPCCAMVATSPTNVVPCCATVASSQSNVLSCISSVKAIYCNPPSSLDENRLLFQIRVRVRVRVRRAATPIGFIGIRLKFENVGPHRVVKTLI